MQDEKTNCIKKLVYANSISATLFVSSFVMKVLIPMKSFHFRKRLKSDVLHDYMRALYLYFIETHP